MPLNIKDLSSAEKVLESAQEIAKRNDMKAFSMQDILLAHLIAVEYHYADLLDKLKTQLPKN